MRPGSKPQYCMQSTSEGLEASCCGLPFCYLENVSAHLHLWVDKTWIIIQKGDFIQELEKIIL